jgi:hypothetical protein
VREVPLFARRLSAEASLRFLVTRVRRPRPGWCLGIVKVREIESCEGGRLVELEPS